MNSVTEDIDALLEELQEEDCSHFPQPKVRLTSLNSGKRTVNYKNARHIEKLAKYTLKHFLSLACV